jgi:hypothetical protein
MVSHGRAVFLSDFLGDPAGGRGGALARASDRGVKGALLMVLDPAEEEFPFDGRTIFESMGGTLAHETRKAGDLRDRYLARLAERKDRLAQLARAVGWHFSAHHTGSRRRRRCCGFIGRWRAGARCSPWAPSAF